MKNADVVRAWVDGRVASGGNLMTDGRKLYSYALCIGTTEDGYKEVRDYTARGAYGFRSQTTSQHVGLAKRLTA